MDLNAQEYLREVVADMSAGGYKTRTEISVGSAAQEIGGLGKEGDIDWILMTTNGRS